MTTETNAAVVANGLWRNNAGLVQLFGLCPLLAVTTTLINGLTLGLATAAVLIVSNWVVSLARRILVAELRLVFYVVVIGTAVSIVDQLMAAYFFGLHRALGIFVPLIAANCAIVARAEVFASRNGPVRALLDGAATGAGFALVLIVLGALRELIGAGTLLADAELLFGPAATGWRVDIGAGFSLAVLPPGAFFSLALLVAGQRALFDRRRAARMVAA